MFNSIAAGPKSQVIVSLVMLFAAIILAIQSKQVTGEASRPFVSAISRFPLKGDQNIGADTYLMTKAVIFT